MKLYIKSEKEPLYVVYAEGTWSNYRALFRRREGPARYSNAADADKFNLAEADRMCRQTNGKYRWVKKQV